MCCSAPARLRAPVDRALRGLRMRRLPGEVCLGCHDVTAPRVEPSPELDRAISVCAAGVMPPLTVLKAWAAPGDGQVRPCAHCPGAAEPAALDVAIGDHAGLVAERLAGRFCWTCGVAVVPDEGEELRRRLTGRDLTAEGGALAPSLVYDTPDHPTALQLEVTTRCNLHCAYCGNRLLADRRDVPLADIVRVFDTIDMSRVDDIDFTGLGEPSLHPDLPAVIAAVRAHGEPSHIRMVTNGVALTPRRFRPLCDAGLTSVSFSIDSLDPGRFARSRSGGRLDRVLRNLEALVAHREAAGLSDLRIKIKAVLLGDPYPDAERLLAYSARLGLDMPHFSCLDTRGAAATLYAEPWLTDGWSTENSAAFLTWARARWAELTPRRAEPAASTGPTLSQRTGGVLHAVLRPPPDVCRWAVDAAFIAAGGGALACCEQMIDIPRMEWGSLARASLAELWNGPLLWGYRLPLTVGAVPARCVGCSWAPAGGVPLSLVAGRRSGPTSRST